MRLVQFESDGGRCVGVVDESGNRLTVVEGAERVYDLALEAARAGQGLEQHVTARLGGETVSYDALLAESRILPPLDHPDPAHCLVTGTGLSHLGSAQARDDMHAKLAAGAEKTQHTYAGHSWLVVDANGKPLVAFKAEAAGRSAIITGDEIPRKPRTERPKSRARTKGGDGGKWRAFVRDHNVWIRAAEGDEKEEVQLSQDGAPDNRYEMLQWTPDSKTLIAFRVQPGEPKEVYRIESSPKDGGRAKLHRHNYALPGDKFASFELNLFDVAERKQIKPEVEPVD